MSRRPRLPRPVPAVFPPAALLAVMTLLSAPAGAGAQDLDRCDPAQAFVVEEFGMEAVVTPDTLEDWRSRRDLPACRVTAAGVTSQEAAKEAEYFYQRLRAAGWTRTPDPRDAPNESSLRFRKGETDCLFNVYEDAILGTAAEAEVNTAVVPGYGESRFNMLVLCTEAVEAAPRP